MCSQTQERGINHKSHVICGILRVRDPRIEIWLLVPIISVVQVSWIFGQWSAPLSSMVIALGATLIDVSYSKRYLRLCRWVSKLGNHISHEFFFRFFFFSFENQTQIYLECNCILRRRLHGTNCRACKKAHVWFYMPLTHRMSLLHTRYPFWTQSCTFIPIDQPRWLHEKKKPEPRDSLNVDTVATSQQIASNAAHPIGICCAGLG